MKLYGITYFNKKDNKDCTVVAEKVVVRYGHVYYEIDGRNYRVPVKDVKDIWELI